MNKPSSENGRLLYTDFACHNARTSCELDNTFDLRLGKPVGCCSGKPRPQLIICDVSSSVLAYHGKYAWSKCTEFITEIQGKII
jgi:hypothetical protein